MSRAYKQNETNARNARIARQKAGSASRSAENTRRSSAGESRLSLDEIKSQQATELAGPQPTSQNVEVTPTEEQSSLTNPDNLRAAVEGVGRTADRAMDFVNAATGDIISQVDQTFQEITKQIIKQQSINAISVGFGGVVSAGGNILKIGKNAQTAVNLASRTGTKIKTPMRGVADKILTNTKTVKVTKTWLQKLGATATSQSGVIAIVGSFPFAGFIKQEALQTLGFAVTAAKENDDIEGMNRALDMQEEILDNQLWEKIIAFVPIVNSCKRLYEFFQAAMLKIGIDRKVAEDMQIKIDTGMTDNDIWDRRNQEKQQSIDDNFEREREQDLIDSKRIKDAQDADREADAKFYAEQAELRRIASAKEREAIAEFWIAYNKENAKARDVPSALNFGLL